MFTHQLNAIPLQRGHHPDLRTANDRFLRLPTQREADLGLCKLASEQIIVGHNTNTHNYDVENDDINVFEHQFFINCGT